MRHYEDIRCSTFDWIHTQKYVKAWTHDTAAECAPTGSQGQQVHSGLNTSSHDSNSLMAELHGERSAQVHDDDDIKYLRLIVEAKGTLAAKQLRSVCYTTNTEHCLCLSWHIKQKQ